MMALPLPFESLFWVMMMKCWYTTSHVQIQSDFNESAKGMNILKFDTLGVLSKLTNTLVTRVVWSSPKFNFLSVELPISELGPKGSRLEIIVPKPITDQRS